jgi:hypothetical protein
MIQHTNGEDISEAYIAEKKVSVLKPNEEFDL